MPVEGDRVAMVLRRQNLKLLATAHINPLELRPDCQGFNHVMIYFDYGLTAVLLVLEKAFF